MAAGHRPFPSAVQQKALKRQRNRCGSCGMMITAPGEAGQADHPFGERAEAHHVIPHRMGGSVSLENCVIICRACHLSAHQGGRWRDIKIYADIAALDLERQITRIAKLYPYYSGSRRT